MNDLLVLQQPDKTAAALAAKHGLRTVVRAGYDVPFDRALFVEPGTAIPWNLVDYGLHFLGRWDAAAPLWRYGVLAQDVGTPVERKRTEAVALDLRVLLYASELLFVRASPAGLALLKAWQEEQTRGPDKRLAFLRALHLVKPLFCALPRSWLFAEEKVRAEQRKASLPQPRTGALVTVEVAPGRFIRCHAGEEKSLLARYLAARAGAVPATSPRPMVTVEVAPSRFVRCRAGEETKMLERYHAMLAGRSK